MSVQIARRHFTVDDFYRMLEAGILTEDDRVELIDGEIIEMSPVGSRHAACVARLTKFAMRLVSDTGIVWPQNPVRLHDESEPLPDLVVLKLRDDFYAQAHPTPDDVLLIVEVADSSVAYDRRVKAPMYAAANVPEFWVVDLTTDTVERYSSPKAGRYAKVEKFGRGQELSAAKIPSLKLGVDDILG